MGLSAAKHVYFRDTRVPGLCLRVSSTGGKVFVFYRKIASRPERIVLGKYPDLTIEQARGMASKNNSVIATGGNPANSKREISNEMNLKELFAQFGEYYGQQKRTWPEMQRQFGVYLQKWHMRKISPLSRSLTSSPCTHASGGSAVPTPRTAPSNCSAPCLTGQSSGDGRTRTPLREYAPTKRSNGRGFLLPEELPQFFRALDAEPNKDIRDYIYLSLFTGARRSNVAAMSWPQINFNRAVWSIPEDQVKAGETLTIELLPEALEILERRKQTATSEWVFPGTGATGHLVEPKKCWRRVLEAAGLPVAGVARAAGNSGQAGGPLRLHDLRRTLGSWQAIGGSSLPIIGKSLGHADGSSATAVYARLNNVPVRKSMEKAVRAMRIAGKVRRKW